MTTPKKAGIPAAIFVESVALHMKGKDVQQEIETHEVLRQKYKYMDGILTQKKANLEKKLPDIESSIQAIDNLIKCKEDNKEFNTQFELSDNIYATAKVKPVNHVNL